MRQTSQLLSGAAMPRAILASRVRANADVKAMFASFNTAFDEFKASNDQRYADLEEAIDQLSAGAQMARLGGSGLNNGPVDREYSETFAGWARRGIGEDAVSAANQTGDRARIQASMSSGSNPDGGYLAPVEWDRNIQQAQVAISPMRRLAQVRSTGVGAFSTIWNGNQWGSGWVGETAARPATSSTQLSTLLFKSGEIYANVAVTQTLLDDAQIDFGTWLAGQIGTEFDRQDGIAFISGDGVNKPLGLLQYVAGGAGATQHPGGALDVVASGAAAAIPNTDILVDFFYGLTAPYRQNATWLMNSMTAASIAKMKDGQDNYIWRESLLIGQPATLLGRPVEIDENMPNLGAGQMPIAFGDFKQGYLINDRIADARRDDPWPRQILRRPARGADGRRATIGPLGRTPFG